MTRRLTWALTEASASGPRPDEPTMRPRSTPLSISHCFTVSTRRWLSRRF